MANKVKWDAEDGSPISVLTTQLDDVTHTNASGIGTPYDNGANLNQYGWLELILGSLTPGAANFITAYMYVYTGGTTEDVKQLPHQEVAVWTLDTGASVKRVVFGPIVLPPFELAFEVVNNLGVTLAASGNSLKLYVANDELKDAT